MILRKKIQKEVNYIKKTLIQQKATKKIIILIVFV